MPSVGLLLRTLGKYQPAQLWNYGIRRIVRPKADFRPAPMRREQLARFAPGIQRPYAETSPNRIRLLNVEHEISSAADWNNPAIEKLWLYTLHYHEWLSAGADHADGQRRLLKKWISENPPPHGVGWDPYPLSLRIVQWIKWLLRGESAVAGMLDSLAVQARFLRGSLETHLGANHLLSNAVALTAAGLFFDDPEAGRWLDSGIALLRRELAKQYHADGGHFERSPSYHGLLLESLLDLENLANAFRYDGVRPWIKVIPGARIWLAAMTRANGTYPQFNDCAEGVAPSPAALELYATAIALGSQPALADATIDLPDTGYVRMRAGRMDAFVDAGPFAPRTQPGHGHCDMLSVELSVDGVPVIVNSGTSTYERSARRTIERSTASHNTVQIGNAEQSEIWSAFRVGRTAKITERRIANGRVIVSHDGYRPLGVMHRRTVELREGSMNITDEITGRPVSGAVSRLHFAPGIVPKIGAHGVSVGPLEIEIDSASDVSIGDYEYASEFNRRTGAKLLTIGFDGRLHVKIRPS